MNTSQFIVLCFMTVFILFFTFIVFKTSLTSMPTSSKIVLGAVIAYTWILIIVTSDVYMRLRDFKKEIQAYRQDMNSDIIQDYIEHKDAVTAEKSQ